MPAGLSEVQPQSGLGGGKQRVQRVQSAEQTVLGRSIAQAQGQVVLQSQTHISSPTGAFGFERVGCQPGQHQQGFTPLRGHADEQDASLEMGQFQGPLRTWAATSTPQRSRKARARRARARRSAELHAPVSSQKALSARMSSIRRSKCCHHTTPMITNKPSIKPQRTGRGRMTSAAARSTARLRFVHNAMRGV